MTNRERILSLQDKKREAKPIYDDKEIVDNFCSSIILAAVDDWRQYRKGCEKYVEYPWYNGLYEQRLRSVERFFLSDWFKALTTINGKWLIVNLEDEFLAENPSAIAGA